MTIIAFIVVGVAFGVALSIYLDPAVEELKTRFPQFKKGT